MVVVVYLEAGLLRGQVSPASHGSQFNGGHGAADVQILAHGSGRLHQGDAVTAAHRLSWILGGGAAVKAFITSLLHCI